MSKQIAPPEGEAAASPSADRSSAEEERAFQRFADVPARLSVELDRRGIRLEELLALGRDSLLVLNRSAGDNVDLLLNGLVIGSGEIVVLDNVMGLRITDLKSVREERVES